MGDLDEPTRVIPPPGPHRRVMLAFGVAGTVLLLWISRFGLGVSPDSVDYVSAARGLLAGHGFVNQWYGVYRHWPPLFPMVLAVLRLLGESFLGPARYFQALGYGAMAAMVVGILWQDLRRRWIAVAGGLLVLVSLPLLGASSKLISEPLFFVLIVAVVYLYPRARARDRFRDLLWIAVPAGLAAIQRYAGVGLLAAVCLYLLLEAGAGTFRRRFQRAVFFGATASAPLALWLARNLVATGSLSGRRPVSHYTLGATVVRALKETGSWWVPRALGPVAGPALICILLAVLAASLVPGTPRTRPLPRLAPRIRFGAWIAFIHIAFMVGAMMHTGLSPLGRRYLAPAAPGLVLLFAGAADELASRFRRRGAVIAATATSVIVVGLGLFTSGRQVAHRMRKVSTARAVSPLSGARWEGSPVLAWVRSLQGAKEPLYTNAYRLVRFYGNPRRAKLRKLPRIDDQLRRRVPGDYVLLDLGRGGWEGPQVDALAARYPDLVRLRGPEGVVLTVGTTAHR